MHGTERYVITPVPRSCLIIKYGVRQLIVYKVFLNFYREKSKMQKPRLRGCVVILFATWVIGGSAWMSQFDLLADAELAQLNAASVAPPAYDKCKDWRGCPGPCTAPSCDIECNQIPLTGTSGYPNVVYGECKSHNERSVCLPNQSPCGFFELPYCALDPNLECRAGCAHIGMSGISGC
jgi:hypothetical protein